MKYRATAEINAPAAQVWSLLTDVRAQNRWNGTLVDLTGEFKKGKKLKFRTKVSPNRAFDVNVADIEPGRMLLTFGMPLGLFKGERVFTVEDAGDGRSRFFTEEVFSGPLVGLMKRTMPDLQPSFDAFAHDLKVAAESGNATVLPEPAVPGSVRRG